MDVTNIDRTFHLKRTEDYTSLSNSLGIFTRIFSRIGFMLSHKGDLNTLNHARYGI